MIRHWVRQSFRRQLFLALLAVTLIMVTCGGIITVQGFRLRLRDEYAENDRLQERVITDQVREMLDTAEETLDHMAADEELLTEIGMESTTATISNIYGMLYRETADIRNYSVVSIYVDGERRYTTDSFSATATLPSGFSVLRMASEHQGENVHSVDPMGEDEGALLIARDLTEGVASLAADRITADGNTRSDTDTWHQVCAVIRIRQRNIERSLSGMLNARDGLILTNSALRPFCILGTAQGSSALDVIRSNILKGTDPSDDISDNIYMSELGDHGLYAVYITPPVLDAQAVRAEVQILIFLMIAGTILSLIVASILAARTSKPIDILAAAMRRLRRGDLEARVDLDREDEFGQLAAGFNKTAIQLTDMMQEQVDNERRLNEARIAMMQAQLNPHFLYNTLDTIKWVAKANQVPEIATLSQSLAGILRTSISEEQFVPLSQELKLIRNYCEIQRIRFDDFFDLTVNVPDELENAYVPKLILQPIVENAIIHGLEDRREGHIVVDVVRSDIRGDRDTRSTDGASELKNEETGPAAHSNAGDMEIHVTDNGKGIDDEMIKALESHETEGLKGHLGLEHVGTILRLYYGEGYGITARRLYAGPVGTEADGDWDTCEDGLPDKAATDQGGTSGNRTVAGTRMTLKLPIQLTRPDDTEKMVTPRYVSEQMQRMRS